MDDEIKELLRDIRDAQREQVEILRESRRQAREVNSKVLENHNTWSAQNKVSTKLMIVIAVVVVLAFIALEVIKTLRPGSGGP